MIVPLNEAELVLVWDVSNMAHKYAKHNVFRNFTNPQGIPTGHLFGTLKKIQSVLNDPTIKDRKIVNFWCLDDYPFMRHELCPAVFGHSYKDRPKETAPSSEIGTDILKIDFVCEVSYLLSCFGGVTAWCPKQECDSVMSTWVHQSPKPVLIVSDDRDMWTMYDHPNCHSILAREGHLKRHQIRSAYGDVEPKAISLWKTMFGDSGDSVDPIIPRLVKKHYLNALNAADGNPHTLWGYLVAFNPKLFDNVQIKRRFWANWQLVKLHTNLRLHTHIHERNVKNLQLICQGAKINMTPWTW